MVRLMVGPSNPVEPVLAFLLMVSRGSIFFPSYSSSEKADEGISGPEYSRKVRQRRGTISFHVRDGLTNGTPSPAIYSRGEVTSTRSVFFRQRDGRWLKCVSVSRNAGREL